MGPFKCPECGIWWAGLEHRCQPPRLETATLWYGTNQGITMTTVRCTCPPRRGDNYLGTCPIHDVQFTYTAGAL